MEGTCISNKPVSNAVASIVLGKSLSCVRPSSFSFTDALLAFRAFIQLAKNAKLGPTNDFTISSQGPLRFKASRTVNCLEDHGENTSLCLKGARYDFSSYDWCVPHR
jgi:hypothetical protein